MHYLVTAKCDNAGMKLTAAIAYEIRHQIQIIKIIVNLGTNLRSLLEYSNGREIQYLLAVNCKFVAVIGCGSYLPVLLTEN